MGEDTRRAGVGVGSRESIGATNLVSGGGEGSAPSARGGGIGVVESMGDFRREVLASPLPVLLAFTAVWCAPCAWLDPYLQEAVREGREGLRVLKTDVDQLPEAAAQYRIGSVPMVLLFKGGEEIERSVGVEPERIRTMVIRSREHLSAPEPLIMGE